MTGAIVNLGKFLSQDFTAGKCAKRRAHYPPAAFTKVMRVRSVTFYSSVNFEMSFWCHCLDQNSNKHIVRISAFTFFGSFLGASWKLFRLLGNLVSNMINKEAYRNPRKPQGSYKNFQDRNPFPNLSLPNENRILD